MHAVRHLAAYCDVLDCICICFDPISAACVFSAHQTAQFLSLTPDLNFLNDCLALEGGAAGLVTCADGEDPNLLRLFQFAQTIVPFGMMLNRNWGFPNTTVFL